MTIKYTGKYVVHFVNSETKRVVDNEEEAHRIAQEYVGNRSFNKPFPNENTYLYGPGNGETSVMIRAEIEWKTKNANTD